MKNTCFLLATVGLSLMLTVSVAQPSVSMLTAYYGVKDALVASSVTNATAQAAKLVTALETMPTTKLAAATKKALATARTQAVALSKTTDLDTQREAFEGLSASMIALAKATKPEKAYVQFCPMAAEGKGASWLSNTREIRNPYYGSKMLKCGSVNEEI